MNLKINCHYNTHLVPVDIIWNPNPPATLPWVFEIPQGQVPLPMNADSMLEAHDPNEGYHHESDGNDNAVDGGVSTCPTPPPPAAATAAAACSNVPH